ncbi:MAG: histidine phosphatase family protein [Pseudomonadota bacterium]
MTHIYLVRHGEAAASWGESADPGLSQLGFQQAESAREQLLATLGDEQIDILSSPLRRAQETAAPLAQQLQQEVRIDERFKEIPSPVPLSERQDWLRAFMQQRWSDQDQGLLRWKEQMLKGLQECARDTVIFTHFLVINSIVGHCEGKENTLVAWPSNASITTVTLDDGVLTLAALGEQMRTRVN